MSCLATFFYRVLYLGCWEQPCSLGGNAKETCEEFQHVTTNYCTEPATFGIRCRRLMIVGPPIFDALCSIYRTWSVRGTVGSMLVPLPLTLQPRHRMIFRDEGNPFSFQNAPWDSWDWKICQHGAWGCNFPGPLQRTPVARNCWDTSFTGGNSAAKSDEHLRKWMKNGNFRVESWNPHCWKLKVILVFR